ncbi:ABC transporter ATP-binding protein [Paenibacillus sp. J2TS4]|uniref:ABC transporter ATP-binding protein n=1 Tax=Paenibacillus sp. J2TS4 TaxID=2807194 RepID=UPI001B14D737|nr:ABC transporter ATP-binding protein [Paenibacillus sp. J2TS4]GIP32014.1 putative multidrug resistance ABC transporter ATP-binding/permease protein YheH [Paenibacillus sp. J2TS4]
MKVGARLVRYALTSKITILVALFLLTLSVAAELTGPLIAKTIIDRHVTGIEEPWYPTAAGEQAVSFRGQRYTRESNLPAGSDKTNPVQIAQVGRSFIFSEKPIPLNGNRIFEDGRLMVTQGSVRHETEATLLSAAEVMAFYAPEVAPIARLLSFYIALILISSFFQFGQRFYLQKAANRIIQRLRTDLFNHLSRLPVRFFDNLPAGKVVSRVTNDTEAIRELYVAVLANFFSSGIYMTGIYVALFLLDARLAFICLGLLPLLAAWIVLYRKFASFYNHRIRSKISEINASLNENIQGMSIIQAFRREEQHKQEFRQLNDEHYHYQNKLLRLNALTSHNLSYMLRQLIFVCMIWYIGGTTAGIGQVLTLGVLYAFVDYVNRLFEPIKQIVNQLANLEQALVAGERVFEFMDKDGEEVVDQSIDRPQGEVVFHHVSFGYKPDEYVLKNLSFTARAGETIALVGHTGSGKSSIMNLLFRFYDCQHGEITIDGKDIKTIPRQALREHMGIVLQEPYLFTGTIASNISLDDPRISREQMEEAMRLVGSEQIFAQLEQGLDEEVQEKGSTLSSGQRQLISFARALVVNPAILVLDEATANIDTETEAVIQQGMEALKSGRTTFIIAHRLSTIQNADKIIVLNQGQIIEQGNHQQLMKLNGEYAQMYRLQQQSHTAYAGLY